MNKPRPIQEVFYVIMRITFTQILIMVVLTSLVSAAPVKSNGQGILDRKVSLDVNNEEIKFILSQIEKQTSVVFTYRPKLINSSKKISLKVDNALLREVLNELFDPTTISVVAVDEEEEILLKAKNETESEEILVTALTINGKITDEAGEPLPGVNVLEKGTTNGTTTDAVGQFSLNVQDANAVVIFSFIGYMSQEIVVGNQTLFNISLVPDAQTLSEVVVIGYGEQKRESIVGSITQTSGKVLQRAGGVSNVGAALTGNLPGVITMSSSGMPGEE